MLPAATCTSRRSDAWGGALQHGMPQHKRCSLQRCVSPPRAAARLDACQEACSRLPSTACALSAGLLLGNPGSWLTAMQQIVLMSLNRLSGVVSAQVLLSARHLGLALDM